MRLIDIDAFYKFCERSLENGHEVYPEYYDDYLGSDMFTVKAIPIEYIERKLAEHWYVDYDIRELLENWEKENEESN